MKTTIKHENDEFLVITLKHVSVPMGHANPPRTSKMWPIAHKKAIKHENGEILVIPLQPVNRLGSPKLRAIAHENGNKTRK